METVKTLSIVGVCLMFVGFGGYFVIGDYKDAKHADYMYICKEAGHTAAQCIFAKHYRQRAAALRGN